MTDHDEIAALADRLLAKQRRGQEPGIEFEIEWGALTEEERGAFMALVHQRVAHGEERLEGLTENVRILRAVNDLLESSGAPPGTGLGEALQARYVTVLEVVEAIRGAMPDPLAQQKPD